MPLRHRHWRRRGDDHPERHLQRQGHGQWQRHHRGRTRLGHDHRAGPAPTPSLPTGGNDVIMRGSGTNTLDLSLLPSYSTFNLGSAAPQQLGAGNGTLAVVPGTIQKVIASPSGSTLQAGPGNNITLVGGRATTGWLPATPAPARRRSWPPPATTLSWAASATTIMIGGSQAGDVRSRPGRHRHPEHLVDEPRQHPFLRQARPSGAQVNLSNQLFSVGSTQLQPGTAAGGWGASVTNLSNAQLSEISRIARGRHLLHRPDADHHHRERRQRPLRCDQRRQHPHRGDGQRLAIPLRRPHGSNIINGGGNSTANFSLAPAGRQRQPPAAPTPAAPIRGRPRAGSAVQSQQSLTGIQNVVGYQTSPTCSIAGAAGQTLTGRAELRRAEPELRRCAPGQPDREATLSSPAAAATTPSAPSQRLQRDGRAGRRQHHDRRERR